MVRYSPPVNRDHGRAPDADLLMSTVLDTSSAVPVLTVTGEIDTLTAVRLDSALDDAMRPGGPGALIVDLRGVTFLASAGISALVGALDRAVDRAVRLRLVVDGNRRVTRPLEISGTAGLLDLYPELEDAVRAEERCGEL